MIPERLEELVIKHKKEGHLPFFVNCTTGIIYESIIFPNESKIFISNFLQAKLLHNNITNVCIYVRLKRRVET